MNLSIKSRQAIILGTVMAEMGREIMNSPRGWTPQKRSDYYLSTKTKRTKLKAKAQKLARRKNRRKK